MSGERWRANGARWWGPRAHDIVIVALCAVSIVIQTMLDWDQIGPARYALVVIPGVIATVAMWWRRSYPVTVFAIVAVAYLAGQVALPLGFALLTVAVRRRDRVLVGCTAVTACCLLLPNAWMPLGVIDGSAVTASVLGALFWALWGAYVGARRDLVTSLRDRAERAEEERELRSDQARLAERARIAREMHDVLAHKVSLIALQAGGLEVNPGMGTDRVQQTAGQIRTTAREALEDLRGVLGVLREEPSTDPASGAGLAPQPGLADLANLVQSSKSAGVRVHLTMDVPPLPDTLGRTVYRVVQEAMTNVHKHARGAETDVVVSVDPAGVLVSVTNRQPVAAGSLLPGSGAGLIGLRERVGLIGGTLTAGPTDDGGWRVEALLPRPGTGVDRAAPERGAAWLAS